ncbi:MAG: 5'-3' exonuclease [Gammaproteobacteria bacterium]
MTDNVYLVDSSIYVFRAWFTVPDSVVNQANEPVNAVYGFADFVYQFLQQAKPNYVAFTFDESLKSSFRNEIFPEYKANRDPAPIELKRQFKYCRDFIEALGICEVGSPHYEADDLIGTLAKRMRDKGHPITILSADKDLAQLITEDDIFWNFAKGERNSIPQIKKIFGVYPHQIADQLAIAGDTVDNIPGVPGIGMATAAKLLNKFSSLDELLQNIHLVSDMKIRGAKRIQGLIADHEDELLLYRKLTEIECEVKLPNSVKLKRKEPDFTMLNDLFDVLNFGDFRREKWMRFLKAA